MPPVGEQPNTSVPEWVATLVGTLVLENAAMQRALASQQAAPVESEQERP